MLQPFIGPEPVYVPAVLTRAQRFRLRGLRRELLRIWAAEKFDEAAEIEVLRQIREIMRS